MDIEIGRGLAAARALTGEHKGALAAYVVLGVVVPFFLLSSEPIFSLRTAMAIAADPWAFRFSGSIAGPLYLLAIVAVIVAGAMLAAWNAILSDVREGYVSEIMNGMVSGAAYLLGNILLALAAGLVAALPFFLFAPPAGNAGSGGLLAEIYRLAVSLVGGWAGMRLCLAGAIMGERGSLNPFSAYAESWRRTGSAQWRLYGFYLAYGLVFGFAFLGLFLLHGAVVMANAPGGALETALSFGWVALFAAYFLGQILIPAGLHRAAQPHVAAEVFT